MADKNDKITLDVKAFAEAVLGGNPKKDEEEDKIYIKRQLTLYLEAVLLAQDFNDRSTNASSVSPLSRFQGSGNGTLTTPGNIGPILRLMFKLTAESVCEPYVEPW